MVVEVTQDTNKKPMVLIRVLKDHDLVLEFSYVAERKKFLSKLENFLQGQKKNLETVPCFRDHMLMNAETKVRFEMFKMFSPHCLRSLTWIKKSIWSGDCYSSQINAKPK